MRIGYARVSTDIAARRLFGLAAGIPLELFALMRSRADVIGLFSNNVVSFSRNVVLSGLSFSLNCDLETSDVIGQSRLCSQDL
jgi:hypothetical protein